MAMLRAEIPARFSQGFNPLPRLDFAVPLAVGVSAAGEIAILDTDGFLDAAVFQERLNQQLPEGFQVTRAANFRIPAGLKKHSPAALLWGFAYTAAGSSPDFVKAADEKGYRQERAASGASLYDLERQQVLARRP
jgi:radical SAM-linked protein